MKWRNKRRKVKYRNEERLLHILTHTVYMLNEIDKSTQNVENQLRFDAVFEEVFSRAVHFTLSLLFTYSHCESHIHNKTQKSPPGICRVNEIPSQTWDINAQSKTTSHPIVIVGSLLMLSWATGKCSKWMKKKC